MKVQCGQCPAKYAVADERVRDKKVRIRCKRCNAAIVVDGKVDPPLVTSSPAKRSARPGASIPPAASAPPASSPPPDSQPSPRPVAHTIMGGLEAPAERLREVRSTPPPKPGRGTKRSPSSLGVAPASPWGMPGPERGFTDPPAGVTSKRWRVALTKQDLRWMTTDEIAQAYRAGAVKHETFVFRTGMPTWLTLLEVPEIAQALADDGAANSPPESAGARSSTPPPRKGQASRDQAAGEADAIRESEADDGDSEDPLPFALVSARSNGQKNVARSGQTAPLAPEAFLTLPLADARAAELTPTAFQAQPPPDRTTESALNGAPGANLATPPAPQVADERPPANFPELVPFAAAHQAGGSSRWPWIVIAVVLIGAAVALLGPRFGFKLL